MFTDLYGPRTQPIGIITKAPMMSHPSARTIVEGIKKDGQAMLTLQPALEKHMRREKLAEKKKEEILATPKNVQAMREQWDALHLNETMLTSQFHHISLRKDSLCRLMVDCVDDDTIYVFLLVAHDCAKAHRPADKVPAILTPLVSSMSEELDGDQGDFHQGLFLEHTRAFPWDTFEETLLPYHWGEHNHWILVVISWATSTVKVYNSLKGLDWNQDGVWAQSPPNTTPS